MFANYSPLFTSGLLSDSGSSSSSRGPSPKHCPSFKHHDSLPMTVNTASFSMYERVHPTQADEHAIYLTIKPSRHVDVEAGRSFLSLDLAESQSMRTMSLRRKDTVTSRETSSAANRSEPTSPSATSPVSPIVTRFAPPPLHLPPPTPVASFRRPSRETLRLPSPKPAPLSVLPDVPKSTSTSPPASAPALRQRRRPSDLVLTLSACFTEAGPSSSSAMSPSFTHRPSYSAPTIMSQSPSTSSPPSTADIRSYLPFTSPTDSVFSLSTPPPTRSFSPLPPPPVSAPPTTLKHAPSMASYRTRQRNRSAALAALEGRGAHAAKRRTRPNNFMSMSDDEDEVDEQAVIQDDQQELLTVLNEEEDIVVPTIVHPTVETSVANSTSKRSSSSESSGKTGSSRRSRRGTIESFFSPLTNFIDFIDDESSSRPWRSFVEISS